VAGFIFSLLRLKQSPRANLLSAIGTSLLVLARIAKILIYNFAVPYWVGSGQLSKKPFIFGSITLFLGVLFFGGIGCLILAVFAGRSSQKCSEQMPPPI
jgi:hypothetical protein